LDPWAAYLETQTGDADAFVSDSKRGHDFYGNRVAFVAGSIFTINPFLEPFGLQCIIEGKPL